MEGLTEDRPEKDKRRKTTAEMEGLTEDRPEKDRGGRPQPRWKD